MKKTTIIFIALLVLLSLPFSTNAEGEKTAEYKTFFDLYQTWGYGYPDYVSGVWTEDGGLSCLTVGIVDTEDLDARSQEILDLIEDDCSVKFITQKYSKNYLLEIQKYVDEFFKSNIGFVATGIYETENVVKIDIHKDYLENEETLKVLYHIEETYGDAVSFEKSEGYIIFTTKMENAEVKLTPGIVSIDNEILKDPTVVNFIKQKNTEKILFISAMILAALATVTLAVSFKKKKQILLQTSNGKTVTKTELSKKEIKTLIKSEELSPSAELDDRIMKDIESTK